MKITKFKKVSNNKYKVYLESGNVISLYEDVIINNNLILTKNIDDELVKKLEEQNDDVHIYTIALKFISVRMRSIKEVENYLSRKNVDSVMISKTIDKLIKEGYLNDFAFALAYSNDEMAITNKGPLRIKKELLNYGVSQDIIDEVSNEINDDILKEKLCNLIEKQIKIRKGSANALKYKIINYLNNLGYESDMILSELSKYNLKSDFDKLKKDYDRLYNKYKGKYEVNNLRNYVIQKLMIKGYTREDINKVIDDEQ